MSHICPMFRYSDDVARGACASSGFPMTGNFAKPTSPFPGFSSQDLGPKDFDDFYVRLRANGLSPASIKRYHSVLGGAFQQAMKWG